jgi:hypothetical protein
MNREQLEMPVREDLDRWLMANGHPARHRYVSSGPLFPTSFDFDVLGNSADSIVAGTIGLVDGHVPFACHPRLYRPFQGLVQDTAGHAEPDPSAESTSQERASGPLTAGRLLTARPERTPVLARLSVPRCANIPPEYLLGATGIH